ncbi:hypothetical protein ElyMa_002271600 [Elysia marginata]|uniref:RUN domain-containing protein n=1 Tax=Elysia marginata TaxID=1093978 RepID=A0AAV4FZ90_9GAST|nr:hypothetical protein ElyMa_002271600 [Elysia marginata]
MGSPTGRSQTSNLLNSQSSGYYRSSLQPLQARCFTVQSDAFLCHEEHVQAMRVCFRAIELNKPALLTDISPQLLRHGQQTSGRDDWLFSSSAFRPPGFESSTLGVAAAAGVSARVGGGARQSANGRARLTRAYSSGWDKMGNKQPRLDVSYSGQLSRSNLSLTVDPSLGASSLLHQKTLSSPYFVSSLDSPRVLEHLHGDIRDAIRTTSNHVAGLGPQVPGTRSSEVNPSNPPLALHSSNSSGTLVPQERTPASDCVHDVGSAPELSLLTDPEVAVVSGLRRSTVIASGPGPPGSNARDEARQTGSDSTARGSVGTGSASTLSISQEKMFHSDQSIAVCDDDDARNSTGVASVYEPSAGSPDSRPKSFSDALRYAPSNQDVFEDSGQGISVSTSGKFDRAPQNPANSSLNQDGGPTRQQFWSEESYTSGHKEGTGSLACSADSNSHIPPNGQTPSSEASKDNRTASHVSVGFDATSLNSILTQETDYGPDGVLFGFSPREDRSRWNSSPIPESEESKSPSDRNKDRFIASPLPEPGDSPSGSLAHKGSTTDYANICHPTYSPDSGARPKISSIPSEPLMAIKDPLLSPSPPMPTVPLSSNQSSFNFPQIHNPENYASSPPLYRGVAMPFSESDGDLYCFSPPMSPLMGLSQQAGDDGSSKKDQSMGSTNSVSVPVKLPGGGGSGGVYIPERGMSLDRGLPGISALAEAQARVRVPGGSSKQGDGSGGGGGGEASQIARTPLDTKAPSSGSGGGRKGHKRWVSDTSVIQVNQQDRVLGIGSNNNNQFGKGKCSAHLNMHLLSNQSK